jgi:hypothetical protein
MELKPKAGSTKESKSDRYRKELEGQIRGLLETGEQLSGIAAASQKKGVFSNDVVALAVTDRRLLIQPLERRGRGPKGEGQSLTKDQIEKVKVGGAEGFADTPSSALMESAAIDLKLWTSGGEKMKFSLMHAEGLFGLMGGGAPQQSGVQALLSFLGEGPQSSI